MGVDRHGLAALRMTAARKPLGQTLTLGRQELHGVAPEIIRDFGPLGTPAARETYCEKFLVDCLGASAVDSLDMSPYEGATYSHDLNLPVPKSLISKYDTVLDLGTLEHIFDINQALSNVSDLCKVGGQILHVLPADNFCGHGFWQFSPELFSALYSTGNGFSETEIYLADLSKGGVWFRVLPLPQGDRLRLLTSSATYVIVRTVKAGKKAPVLVVNQEDYVLAWSKGLGPKSRSSLKPSLRNYVVSAISRATDLVRKVWLLEMALIAPYRFFANRRSSLSRWNKQLSSVIASVGKRKNQKNLNHRPR